MIYHLDSVADVMRSVLNERMRKNKSYSLRAFARDLDLSPSHLSQVLNNKKRLSQEKFSEVLTVLSLSEDEGQYFHLLNEKLNTKDDQALAQIEANLNKIQNRHSVEVRESDAFTMIAEWYHVAILELSYKDNFQFSEENIATELSISKEVVQSALGRLMRLGLIQQNGRIYTKTDTNLAFQSASKNEAFIRFNEQMCDLGKSSIGELPIEERIISTQTFCMDKKYLPEAKEIIREFSRKMTDLFYRSETKDELFQLNIHFFPIAKANKVLASRTEFLEDEDR